MPFWIWKVWKGREKITKNWMSQERKELNIFHSFWRPIIWWKNKNLIKNSWHKLYLSTYFAHFKTNQYKVAKGYIFTTARRKDKSNPGNDKTRLVEDFNEKLQVYIESKDEKSGFEIQLKEKAFARRGMLSALSGIYDQLGLVALFMLEGRKQIQRLRIGWVLSKENIRIGKFS